MAAVQVIVIPPDMGALDVRWHNCFIFHCHPDPLPHPTDTTTPPAGLIFDYQNLVARQWNTTIFARAIDDFYAYASKIRQLLSQPGLEMLRCQGL